MQDKYMNIIKENLIKIYGDKDTEYIIGELSNDLQNSSSDTVKSEFSEKDMYLITYADSVNEEGIAPLQTLHKFANKYLKGIFNNIHILPFYPYSSDDGFSVIDYEEVNHAFGSWVDIKNMQKDFDLMFDYVVNHISAKSDWFKGFLDGNERYSKYFIEQDWVDDLTKVTRPRSLPLLTEFDTKNGKKNVWTTFSEDQIDLNFASPDVFIDTTKILLKYIDNGAKTIRLDAIGYLWKEVGTSCIHQENTHLIIQTWQAIVQYLEKDVRLIAEVNETHSANMGYIGNKDKEESNMVYEFAVASLTLHAIVTGCAKYINSFADDIGKTKIKDGFTYVNLLACHDGVGLNSLNGFLSEDEKKDFLGIMHDRGHLFGYKNVAGEKREYELNSTYFDALKAPQESFEIGFNKFMLAHFILLSQKGVPFIYINSLFGARNYLEGVKKTGMNRTSNREKFDLDRIEKSFNKESNEKQIFDGLTDLIKIRQSQDLFHPVRSEQRVIDLGDEVFAIEREVNGKKLIAIANVTARKVSVDIKGKDIITGQEFDGELKPYQYVWVV